MMTDDDRLSDSIAKLTDDRNAAQARVKELETRIESRVDSLGTATVHWLLTGEES
jgi:hypothetical protein